MKSKRRFPVSLRLDEAVLKPPFQESILQGELPHQPLQLLYPVLESPLLGGFIVELTSTVLLLPVVKHLEVMLYLRQSCAGRLSPLMSSSTTRHLNSKLKLL
jgi:hypothetical protein